MLQKTPEQNDANWSSIAVFDFDGTLIRRNTLIDFFTRMFPLQTTIVCGIRILPSIIAFLMGTLSNTECKERLLGYYLRGMPHARLAALGTAYTQRLDTLVNKKMIDRLAWHRKCGHTVVIISASIHEWIAPWAKEYADTVLATRLEVRGGILTGRMNGANCYGPEKVARLLEAYPDRSHYTLYAYGDGTSDKELLQDADHSFWRTSSKD